jgi:Fur family iron response transcriptional regulator
MGSDQEITRKLSTADEVRQYLFAHGINPTRQRVTIGEALFAENQHLTADRVFEIVKERDRTSVSRATVYNTLSLFVEKGLLREVFVDSSRTFYDTNLNPHHHFYNVDTGDLIDMKEQLEPFFTDNGLPENTTLETVDLVIRVSSQ